MSETVRVYSTSMGKSGRRRKGSPLGRFLRNTILILVVVLLLYGFWTTRDVYPLERFIPQSQRVQIVVVEPLAKREAVASSPVWQSMPAFTGLQRVPDVLNQATKVPSWILNNCIGSVCHVSANDLNGFSDVLFVTKMTRIGTLFERFHTFSRSVTTDPAGGLDLRKIADANVYYAVRGRVLIVSPSREMLIRALTVPRDEALPKGAVTRARNEVGREDLSGTVVLTKGDPMGQVFSSLSFAVAVEGQQLQVLFRGAVNDEWKARVQEAFGTLKPVPLAAPPDGMIALSANFGTPVKALWSEMGSLLDLPMVTAGQWEAWATPPREGQPGLPLFLTTLTGDLGPSVRLSVAGVDPNAILPLPELVGVFEGSSDSVSKAFAALPAVPEDTPEWASVPRFDAESGRAYLPMVGGPSLEPTAGAYADGLLVSTSRTVAEGLLAAAAPTASELPEGNLYLRVDPRRCVESATAVGNLLAEENLLKGYDQASFSAAANQWLASAGRIAEITALAGYDDGSISGDLKVTVVGQ